MGITKKRKRTKILLAILIVLILSISWIYWGNKSIKITKLVIKNEKISENLSGFTIVQVSDLHNAEFGKNQIKLLSKITTASPDIIAVTGDLIDSGHTNIKIAMDFIRRAVEIAPVYFVTGNHEAWANKYSVLKEELEQAGVIILNNKSVEIEYGTKSICLMGVTDPSFSDSDKYMTEVEKMEATLKVTTSDENQYSILLSHRPELFEVYVQHNIDLVLSGHAHGGQFRIPFIGGLIAPNQGFFPLYTSGIYESNQTKMIVSQGLGNSIIPVRINNRPELIIITLSAN